MNANPSNNGYGNTADTSALSPAPFSPFSLSSSRSFGSEGGTSDEPADLGQLAAVFEVLRTEYQPRLVIPPAGRLPLPRRPSTPSSSLLVSVSDDDGNRGDYDDMNDNENNISNEYSGDSAKNEYGFSHPYLKGGAPAMSSSTVWAREDVGEYLSSPSSSPVQERGSKFDYAYDGGGDGDEDRNSYMYATATTNYSRPRPGGYARSRSLPAKSYIEGTKYGEDEYGGIEGSEDKYDYNSNFNYNYSYNDYGDNENENEPGEGDGGDGYNEDLSNTLNGIHLDVEEPSPASTSWITPEPSWITGSTGADADDDSEEPSLGSFAEALTFLAAERAKFTAAHGPFNAEDASGKGGRGTSRSSRGGGAGERSSQSTSESAWRHVVEPRRKRRRKRGGKHANANAGASTSAGPASAADAEVEVGIDNNEGQTAYWYGGIDGVDTPVGLGAGAGDVEGSSSEYYEHRVYGQPPTASRSLRKLKGNTNVANNSSAGPKLAHSRSTPSLRLTVPNPLLTPTSGTTTIGGGNNGVATTSVSTTPRGTLRVDPRVLRLRTLATKLRMLFVEDARSLGCVYALRDDALPPGEDGFIDVRGRSPGERDPPVHVFIDHSNILIGFLNHLRRYPVHPRRPAGTRTHLSHAALALILERGRPIGRRVLATSSPLYQSMDVAERLGYEVRVYARVPDLSDGTEGKERTGEWESGKEKDREGLGRKGSKRRSGGIVDTPSGGSKMYLGHARKASGGGSGSAESDPDLDTGMMLHFAAAKSASHSRNVSLMSLAASAASSSAVDLLQYQYGSPASLSYALDSPTVTAGAQPSRIRYREQGVDELLQLKLLQAISDADADYPVSASDTDGTSSSLKGGSTGGLPLGATIVLATGDGNAGQFNEAGFRGCVRTALRKGWNVELYAWEIGLSRMWMKEFGGAGERFKIIGLEKFAVDLLELS